MIVEHVRMTSMTSSVERTDLNFKISVALGSTLFAILFASLGCITILPWEPDKSSHGQKLPCRFLQGGQTIPHHFARVDKTFHTDMTGWTKDPILIVHPGQNVPFLSTKQKIPLSSKVS